MTAVAAKTYEFPDSQSLRVHARLFVRFVPVQIIVAFLVAALALRLGVGDWKPSDVIGPLVIVAVEPFLEWAIHVYLLHFRPREVRGRTRDLFVAKKHRAHHNDPRNVPLVLLPTRVPVVALPIACLLTLVLGRGDYPRALSTLTFGFLMLLTYEWTHFLIHSKYRPRGWFYKLIWRNHRNHHFRNENYWFCVTTDIADRVLRTAPARDAVPVSPTARSVI